MRTLAPASCTKILTLSGSEFSSRYGHTLVLPPALPPSTIPSLLAAPGSPTPSPSHISPYLDLSSIASEPLFSIQNILLDLPRIPLSSGPLYKGIWGDLTQVDFIWRKGAL